MYKYILVNAIREKHKGEKKTLKHAKSKYYFSFSIMQRGDVFEESMYLKRATAFLCENYQMYSSKNSRRKASVNMQLKKR